MGISDHVYVSAYNTPPRHVHTSGRSAQGCNGTHQRTHRGGTRKSRSCGGRRRSHQTCTLTCHGVPTTGSCECLGWCQQHPRQTNTGCLHAATTNITTRRGSKRSKAAAAYRSCTRACRSAMCCRRSHRTTRIRCCTSWTRTQSETLGHHPAAQFDATCAYLHTAHHRSTRNKCNKLRRPHQPHSHRHAPKLNCQKSLSHSEPL